jgi:ribulose-phosphate 3-epimerase
MSGKRIFIAPSVLSADFSIIKEELKKIENADFIHCDVMDGAFVPNISFGPKMVADIRKCTDVPLDVHLMIEKPERYIEAFAKAGADYITVHYEACKENLNTVLTQIKKTGKKSGAVINPLTPVSVLKGSLPYCDLILLMSVNPGFGGQKFIESVLEKLKEARDLIDKSGNKILLEIDGGINEQNTPVVIEAGADVIVAGTYVFGSENPSQTIENMRKGNK